MAKIRIEIHGDPSVGIPSTSANIEMPTFWDDDEELKEYVRDKLAETFGEFYDDGSVEVLFEEAINAEIEFEKKLNEAYELYEKELKELYGDEFYCQDYTNSLKDRQ